MPRLHVQTNGLRRTRLQDLEDCQGHGTGARHQGHTRAEQAHLDQEDGIGHQCHPDGATEVFWRFILHLCRSSPLVGFDRMIVVGFEGLFSFSFSSENGGKTFASFSRQN
jgi:hypothetical protein